MCFFNQFYIFIFVYVLWVMQEKILKNKLK